MRYDFLKEKMNSCHFYRHSNSPICIKLDELNSWPERFGEQPFVDHEVKENGDRLALALYRTSFSQVMPRAIPLAWLETY